LKFNQKNYELQATSCELRVRQSYGALVFLCFCAFVMYSVIFYNLKPLYAGISFIKFRHTVNIETKKALAEKFLDSGSPYKDNLRQRFANQIFLEAGGDYDTEYLKWGIERAIEEMKMSFKEHRGEFSYPFTLGNLYIRRALVIGDVSYDNSIFYYKEALKLSPNRQPVIFQIATAYLLNGENQNAIDILREAVAYNDNIGQPHWRLGIALLTDGQKELAYKSFKNSIERGFYGTLIDEMKRVAALCEEFNDSDCVVTLVIEIYETLITEGEESVESFLQLASAYTEVKRYEDAQNMLLRITHIDPSLEQEVQVLLRQIGY
ncbi:tetratricopeptide repeat protein, partial [Patescibacteria group bacterium]